MITITTANLVTAGFIPDTSEASLKKIEGQKFTVHLGKVYRVVESTPRYHTIETPEGHRTFILRWVVT